MKLGVHLPQWGVGGDRQGVLSVAAAAEESGFDSVWVADHVTFPVETQSPYPYRSSGPPFDAEDGFLDGLTMLGVVAGATTRVRLGTSVLLAPLRSPLELAKRVATLDVLSSGRVELALGVGWRKEEYEAVGIPFGSRGTRLDEMVVAMSRLWRDGRGSWAGSTFSYPAVVCEPRPLQPGGPPIWIGGTTEAALRRAVRCGYGWHGVGGDPSRVDDARRRLRELADEEGRDPDQVRISLSVGLPSDATRATEKMMALARTGVDQAVLNLAVPDAPQQCDILRSVGPRLIEETSATG